MSGLYESILKEMGFSDAHDVRKSLGLPPISSESNTEAYHPPEYLNCQKDAFNRVRANLDNNEELLAFLSLCGYPSGVLALIAGGGVSRQAISKRMAKYSANRPKGLPSKFSKLLPGSHSTRQVTKFESPYRNWTRNEITD